MKSIQSTIKNWQDKLGLQEWKIDFELVDKFARKDNYPQTGDIKVNLQKKQATILILKTAPKTEEIVAHELVHLLLWEWDHSIEKLARNKQAQEKHMEFLENTTWKLTRILLNNNI